MTEPTPRRFRFSLRWLLVVVTLVGVLLGWIGMQLRWIHDRREALQWILPLHQRQIAAEVGNQLPPRKGVTVSNAESTAPWSLRLFGEWGVERIEIDPKFLHEGDGYSLDELRMLFPEADVVAVR